MDPRLIAPAVLVAALLVLAGAVVLWSGSHLGATLATVGGIDPAAASTILAAQGRVNAALLAILALGLAAAVIGGYVIGSTLGRELAEVGDTIESVAAKVSAGGGDFSTRIPPTGDPRKDRVVHGLNALLGRFEAMVAQATRAGIKVTTSMTQISAGTKELEATMAEQVATTSEVTATAQIIAATATQLLSTMDEVVALSDGTVGNVATGRAALGDMQETMTRMRDASEKVSRRLNAINEHAAEIATVVTTITKVADQTNLLSLNAGIEAEKAGEYGHGFAVVAREIRRLADQTAVATLDIEKMVNQMKSAVGSGVMSTETLTQEVRETGSAVAHVGELLAKVIESVEALNPRFEGVHEGVRAQAHSAEKISRAMEQIGEATVQTAQSLRDTNQSLSELSEAAAVLQDEFARRDPASVGSRTAA